MFEVVRWVVAGALLLLGAHVSVLNWMCVIRGLRRLPTSTWLPLLGGVLGTAGCLIAPSGALQSFWWLPLCLDFGTLPGLTWTLIAQLFDSDWKEPG